MHGDAEHVELHAPQSPAAAAAHPPLDVGGPSSAAATGAAAAAAAATVTATAQEEPEADSSGTGVGPAAVDAGADDDFGDFDDFATAPAPASPPAAALQPAAAPAPPPADQEDADDDWGDFGDSEPAAAGPVPAPAATAPTAAPSEAAPPAAPADPDILLLQGDAFLASVRSSWCTLGGADVARAASASADQGRLQALRAATGGLAAGSGAPTLEAAAGVPMAPPPPSPGGQTRMQARMFPPVAARCFVLWGPHTPLAAWSYELGRHLAWQGCGQ